jgi:hypothetical protein
MDHSHAHQAALHVKRLSFELELPLLVLAKAKQLFGGPGEKGHSGRVAGGRRWRRR